MVYGLTWTGLSEMLVADPGPAGSQLSRKGCADQPINHNPRGDSTDLLPSLQLGAQTLVVDRSSGRAAFPRAQRIFCGLSTRCVAAEAVEK
jgi:hypothetical protein